MQARAEEAEEKVRAESEKRHRLEAQVAEAIKTLKRNRQYVFKPRVIKRKFAFIAALAIISVIAFAMSVFKSPPVTIGDAVTILEDTPAVTIDVPANDTDINNDTLTVYPAMQKTAKLTVLDGYNQRNKKALSAEGKTSIVQSSDNNRWATSFGSYISYDFSDVSIPADAAIKSVVVHVEHFEEERFAQGKLKWSIGTGWPTKPVIWASINAPVHEEEHHEAVDSWDVTGVVDTLEKINSLQLQVQNNENFANRKTLIDYIYVVVEWD